MTTINETISLFHYTSNAAQLINYCSIVVVDYKRKLDLWYIEGRGGHKSFRLISEFATSPTQQGPKQFSLLF